MYDIVSNEYMKVSYDVIEGKPLIHAEVYQWSKDILMKEIWPLALYSYSYLASLGYDTVYTSHLHSDTKVRKFQEMLGFKYLNENTDGAIMSRSTKIGASNG